MPFQVVGNSILIEFTPATLRRRAARCWNCNPRPAAATGCAATKHIGHPIIGDATHGRGPLNRALAGWLGLQRLWLHASALALPHPVTGAPLLIKAALGAEWARWDAAAEPVGAGG